MTKATVNMAKREIKCSRLSTSKVHRGGTKKKLKAVTAPKADTRDGTLGRL